jgi:hypothetical protein
MARRLPAFSSPFLGSVEAPFLRPGLIFQPMPRRAAVKDGLALREAIAFGGAKRP